MVLRLAFLFLNVPICFPLGSLCPRLPSRILLKNCRRRLFSSHLPFLSLPACLQVALHLIVDTAPVSPEDFDGRPRLAGELGIFLKPCLQGQGRGTSGESALISALDSTLSVLIILEVIADALAADRTAEAHARSLLLVAAADQAAIDQGSWLVGSELLLEGAAPPLFRKAQTPASSRGPAHQDSGLEVDGGRSRAYPGERKLPGNKEEARSIPDGRRQSSQHRGLERGSKRRRKELRRCWREGPERPAEHRKQVNLCAASGASGADSLEPGIGHASSFCSAQPGSVPGAAATTVSPQISGIAFSLCWALPALHCLLFGTRFAPYLVPIKGFLGACGLCPCPSPRCIGLVPTATNAMLPAS